jgi:DNA-binding NarL/FixJ family response regulator
MRPIRVLLVEDHDLVRAGFRSLINNLQGIVFAGEAADGRTAMKLVKSEHPDIVIMDIAMPDLNGIEATRRITSDYPDVRVIILSMHSTEEHYLAALRAGASGYILKDSPIDVFREAIQTVANGKTYMTPDLVQRVDEYVQRTGLSLEQSAFQPDLSSPLTPRQREVLQLIAEGQTTSQIADILHVSIKTVETHRANLMDRLNIHNVPGLVRFAIRKKMITVDL